MDLETALSIFRENRNRPSPEQQKNLNKIEEAFRFFVSTLPSEEVFVENCSGLVMTARMLHILWCASTKANQPSA